MAFLKNPNEINYPGGKKHFCEVIKNSGAPGLLIWKQPEEDFNTNSRLVVMPGESAIFVKSGTIEEVFSESGTYKLTTQNYPFISRIRNAVSGGISMFNCVVYFVRAADSQEILWGASSPILVRDTVHNIRTEVLARGAYKVRITDPAAFLQKLVGSGLRFETQKDLDSYFSNELQSVIRSQVALLLNNYNGELIGLDEHLEELSQQVTPLLDRTFREYGLTCVRFSLSGLDVDTTKYDRLDEMRLGAMARAQEALGERAALDALGEEAWWTKLQSETLVGTSKNMGGSGAGLGMGIAEGMILGKMMGGLASPLAGAVPVATTVQGSNTSAFARTDVQGTSAQQPVVQPSPAIAPVPQSQPAAEVPVAQSPAPDPVAVLTKMKALLDAGLITQEDYDAKKKEVLASLM